MHAGSLESTGEAQELLEAQPRATQASWMVSKLPKCIHNSICTHTESINNCLIALLNEIYDEKAENPGKNGKKPLTKYPRERMWHHHSAQQAGMHARVVNPIARISWLCYNNCYNLEDFVVFALIIHTNCIQYTQWLTCYTSCLLLHVSSSAERSVRWFLFASWSPRCQPVILHTQHSPIVIFGADEDSTASLAGSWLIKNCVLC